MTKDEKILNMSSCMLSILDSLKLFDTGSLELGDETLSEVMFRKMKAYNIDLNKELGFDHLKPVTKTKKIMTIKNKYVDRLYQEWIQHGSVILGIDFDDTIKPWKFKSDEDLIDLDKTINLIKLAKETGAYVVIFTACSQDRYEEIRKHCESIKLPIDTININPIELPYGLNGKIYANIFLDDRAGLNDAREILESAMYMYRGYKESQRLSKLGDIG